MRSFTSLALATSALLLLACTGKGLDQKLDTGHGRDAYTASINQAAIAMTQEDREAFDWAVSDLSIEVLNQRYPNGTPRGIIRGEAQVVQADAPKRIAELESVKPKYDTILGEIEKLTATDTEFVMERDFHGLQPLVTAIIHNNSRLPISQMKWRASLYLDDQQAPVATSVLMDMYNNSSGGDTTSDEHAKVAAGGLPAGGAGKRLFRIGFVSGDPKWITLEVQNAKVRRVVLERIPESVKDFGDRFYLEGAPYQGLAQWKNTLASANKLSKY
jgi:hypothetical protein